MASPENVTQKQLAQILGYDERQIRRWQKHPEAPPKTNGGYDVAAWKTFAAAHGRKSPSERKADLEAEKLEIHNERQRFKHECEQGAWTPNTVIEPALMQFSQALLSHLENLLERRLPVAWANKTAAELKELGRQEFDTFTRRIQTGCEQIKAQFPVPTEEEEPA